MLVPDSTEICMSLPLLLTQFEKLLAVKVGVDVAALQGAMLVP